MAESSVMISLPQMVDLALNSPEVGAVNFNILHSLLHVLIQQVDLLQCNVEFKGDTSERVQNLLTRSPPAPTLNLTEYVVTPGNEQRRVISKKARYKTVSSGSKEEVLVERELQIINQRKDSREDPTFDPQKLVSFGKDADTMQTVVVVENNDHGTNAAHVTVALSRAHFDNMEEEIDKLKQEVQELKELPTNLGLIGAIRNSSSTSNATPVLDMFQILTLSKRIDGTEEAITKLASMLEDLVREQATGSLLPPPPVSTAKPGEKVDNNDTIHTPAEIGTQKAIGSLRPPPSVSTPKPQEKVDNNDTNHTPGTQKVSADLKEEIEKLNKRVQALEQNKSYPEQKRLPPAVTKDKSQDKSNQDGQTKIETRSQKEGISEERFIELEDKFTEYTEHISTMDSTFNNQVNSLQKHLTDIEKEIGEIVEKINAGLPAGDTGGSEQGGRELFNKMLAMEEEMEKLTDTAAKLLNEKDDRQTHMDALLEQIELLKSIKANREDLQDALADKADACAVNRKVSHDQFDAACDDLSRSIEAALNKLTQQELLWQQALDDIQGEIENKLDKMELTPLRDFIHNKLKVLQDRLKALAALKKDTEAAGSKSKFLRNVNCISCDKEVVMRKEMDPSLVPPPPSLPPTKSMGPYLAYELDQLRKQQKCASLGRNLHHFENAMAPVKLEKNDHMCNRYCGGSHTTTTPQQRVARLGHFLQQWDTESHAVINEGEIRGTDGHMYRSGGDKQSKTTASSMISRPSMRITGDILSARGRKKGLDGADTAVPSVDTSAA